ncbi:MAG: DUF554 domain-containing protein [Planctomycetota bacterium]
MWSILNGTIINAITVIVGSLIGVSAGRKLPDRYQTIVLQSLGLVTLTLGVDSAVLTFADTVRTMQSKAQFGPTYGARLAMVMIGSLLIGAILGTFLRLHERLESLGGWIHRRFSSQDGHAFTEGFLTASVIFCVGPLTLLGCLRNGSQGDPSFLYIKSTLDGFCSMALAASLGWGVFASVLTVLGFQGGLSLLAYWVAEPLDELSLALMTVVGGVILLATALMILDLRKIAVANMLPGIFLPPLIVWLVERIAPGQLLPILAPVS